MVAAAPGHWFIGSFDHSFVIRHSNFVIDTNLTHVIWGGSGKVPLIIGAVLLYAASRASVDAIAEVGASPGKRAVGHFFPIAAAAILATLMREGGLALSIIFSTSVAALSLVLGSIVLVSPEVATPPTVRRLWPFVLPAALLTLLAGFAGRLTWIHAIVLLAEGAVLLLAWTELSRREASAEPQNRPAPAHLLLRNVNLVICLGLSGLGGAAAILGAVQVSQHLPALTAQTTVVAVLAPLLVAPMLVAGAAIPQQQRSWITTTTAVGLALLNLCLLLPATILLWYLIHARNFDLGVKLGLRTDPLPTSPPLIFTMITWRVDNVVLILLGFMLVPVALGRWRLGRAEGITLVGLYVVYILMEAAAGARY
jgi:Ca2+/Na+ antiporter